MFMIEKNSLHFGLFSDITENFLHQTYQSNILCCQLCCFVGKIKLTGGILIKDLYL